MTGALYGNLLSEGLAREVQLLEKRLHHVGRCSRSWNTDEYASRETFEPHHRTLGKAGWCDGHQPLVWDSSVHERSVIKRPKAKIDAHDEPR